MLAAVEVALRRDTSGSASGLVEAAGANEAEEVAAAGFADPEAPEVDAEVAPAPLLLLVMRLDVSVFKSMMSLPCTASPLLLFLSSRVRSILPPSSRSRTSDTRTLMTPKKPWFCFLNFFWSKIWTATTDASLTVTSKLSFQYGLSVFLMTEVVCVCSPSTVTIANGSGSLKTSRLARPSAATMLMRILRDSWPGVRELTMLLVMTVIQKDHEGVLLVSKVAPNGRCVCKERRLWTQVGQPKRDEGGCAESKAGCGPLIDVPSLLCADVTCMRWDEQSDSNTRCS